MKKTMKRMVVIFLALLTCVLFASCDNKKQEGEQDATGSSNSDIQTTDETSGEPDENVEQSKGTRFLPVNVSCRQWYGDNSQDSFYTSIAIFYDESNRLKQKELLFFDDEINISGTKDYIYDEKGNLIEESYVDSEGGSYTNEYIYDTNGNIIKIVYASPVEETITEYTYDDRGNVIKEVFTDSNGATCSREYTYDMEGNVTQEIYEDFTDLSPVLGVWSYIYDETGNMTKRIWADLDGNVIKSYHYSYDTDGHLVKYICETSDGVVEEMADYGYGTSGTLSGAFFTFSNGCREQIKIKFELFELPYEMTDEEYRNFIMDLINACRPSTWE